MSKLSLACEQHFLPRTRRSRRKQAERRRQLDSELTRNPAKDDFIRDFEVDYEVQRGPEFLQERVEHLPLPQRARKAIQDPVLQTSMQKQRTRAIMHVSSRLSYQMKAQRRKSK